jgi:AcrR family transcriptional regulator
MTPEESPPDSLPPDSLRIVPRQRRAAVTVQRVLLAALEVLRQTPERERDGIVMETLARAAGVSVPAIYRYFGSVDAVFAALVQQEQARILRQGLAILAARPLHDRLEAAAALVDFFIQVFQALLENPGPVLFLLRKHHEVGYAAFAQAAGQIRTTMEAAGLLERPLDDVQIITALSSLASAIKAVILNDHEHLGAPAFRDRMVRMVLGIMDTPVTELQLGEPIEWRYDRRP